MESQYCWLIFISALFFLSSAFAFKKNYDTAAILLLIGGAFCLRLFIVFLDPFLNNWDERFHALVAKNMMDHPFKPTLRENPVLPYNYTDWTDNYIWLHKQPFFLWQIVLSMKIFGVNEYAVRMPGAFLGAIQLFFIYRMGRIIINKQTGYFAALLFACSYFQLQQTSGLIGMDENDIAFGFYTIASLWSLAEYKHTNKKYWLFFIGIFSGIAILNKWLTGLLVYAIWGIIIFTGRNKTSPLKESGKLAFSVFVTAIIFLPWQIYIMHTFPAESHYEYHFNNMHFSTALEGHGGTSAYYINQFNKEHFGYWAMIPFMCGVYYLLKKGKERWGKILVIIPVFIIYAFFSFLVASKTSAFVFVVASQVYILIAGGLIFLYESIPAFRFKKISAVSGILIVCFINLSPGRIMSSHFKENTVYNRDAKINNTEIYKQLNELVPAGYVVLNVPELEHVDAMFYSERNVYHWWPSEADYNLLKEKNIPLAAFQPHHNLPVPDYIANDTSIHIIQKILK